jgi:hypothetical protein
MALIFDLMNKDTHDVLEPAGTKWNTEIYHNSRDHRFL